MKSEKNEIEIKKLGINGEGIGYYNRKIVFVDGALPGETVNVEFCEDNEKYIKGKIVDIVKPSPSRQKPFCPHYAECGGCSLQHLEYKESLCQKRLLIIEALSKYTKLNPRSFEIKPTIGMENPLHYRNKSALPVKYINGKSCSGIYVPNSNRLIVIDDCPIQMEDINRVNKEILVLMDRYNIRPYDEKSNTGVVKYIVTRIGHQTNEIQVTLVLGETKTSIDELTNAIFKIDKVVSVSSDINKGNKTNEIFGNKLKKHYGSTTIRAYLGDYLFSLLPTAFFQLNPYQTEKLYDEIKKAAKLSRKEVVVDAYCGVGTIGIWLSKNSLKVIGIENNKDAVTSANFNAINNNIPNIEFICGDALEEMKKIKDIDVVLVDPPRVGLGELAHQLLQIAPKRIVYTSCNPSTFAKDVNILSEKYDIKYIQPIDMFPFTAHVESVTLLSLKKQ